MIWVCDLPRGGCPARVVCVCGTGRDGAQVVWLPNGLEVREVLRPWEHCHGTRGKIINPLMVPLPVGVVRAVRAGGAYLFGPETRVKI